MSDNYDTNKLIKMLISQAKALQAEFRRDIENAGASIKVVIVKQ